MTGNEVVVFPAGGNRFAIPRLSIAVGGCRLVREPAKRISSLGVFKRQQEDEDEGRRDGRLLQKVYNSGRVRVNGRGQDGVYGGCLS